MKLKIFMQSVMGLCLLAGIAIALLSGKNSAHAGPEIADVAPPSPAQMATLFDAEEKLIHDCMQGHGFSYQPARFSYSTNLFPYGIDDVAWAGANGLGVPPSAEASGSTPSSRSLSQSEQQRYAEQLNGPAAGMMVKVTLPYSAGTIGHNTAGCEVDAESALYGTFNTWFETKSAANSLLPLVQSKVRAEPSYQRRIASWTVCMGDLGYPYASPEDAAESFAENPSKIGNAKSVASAEARCTVSTGLSQEGYKLQHQVIRGLPEQYRSLIYAFWTASLNAALRANPLIHSR